MSFVVFDGSTTAGINEIIALAAISASGLVVLWMLGRWPFSPSHKGGIFSPSHSFKREAPTESIRGILLKAFDDALKTSTVKVSVTLPSGKELDDIFIFAPDKSAPPEGAASGQVSPAQKLKEAPTISVGTVPTEVETKAPPSLSKIKLARRIAELAKHSPSKPSQSSS